jgi:hypothetical protein
MNLEKVIELGNQIKAPELKLFIFDMPVLVVFGIIVILIAIAASTHGITSHFAFLAAIFLALGGSIYHLVSTPLNYTEQVKEHLQELEEWKTETADPFIESLPNKTQELAYVKISPDSANTDFYHTDSNTKDTKRVRLTVAYTDTEGNLVTKTGWIEAKMTLDEKAKPYMDYKQLDKSLGNELSKGLYNAKIYLPKNFTFTEIK